MTRETLSLCFQVAAFIVDKIGKKKELTEEEKKELLLFLETKGFHFTKQELEEFLKK